MLDFFKRNFSALTVSSEIKKDERVRALASELGVSTVTAGLLLSRGYDDTEKCVSFIMKRCEMLHDPFFMKDIKKGADKLLSAVENGENIVIYGDYDVDGVTSVSILYLYLKKLGATVSYYIPDRTGEGYGISTVAIDKIAESGAELIVTVDTGITAVAEADYIKSLGIDLIITDHHECHIDIPKADAVINPRQPDCSYPFKELAGVGVVFKLLCAMEQCRRPEDAMIDCVRDVSLEYCDLVAIGTVADVMPVKDENRLIVSFGLSLMEKNPRPAVKELLAAATGDSGKSRGAKKITSGVIGFTLAPRINAAGRLKNASLAVELFLSEDHEKTVNAASALCEINRERQAEENKIIESAYEKIEQTVDLEHDKVIVLSDENWHHGVIGIVASRITEKYQKPSILVSFEGGDNHGSDGDPGKGSGRSVKGFNLVEALTYCSDLLVKYGGHKLAAGLTVSRGNLDAFREKINYYATEVEPISDEDEGTVADMELEEIDITMENAKELYLFEPFGVSNPIPTFLMRGVRVDSVNGVGGGKHLKLTLRQNAVNLTAMYFRHTLSEADIYVGDTVDVLFNLDINSFQGRESLQLIVKDISLCSSQLEEEVRDRKMLSSILDETFDFSSVDKTEAMKIVPSRDDFAVVYNTLRRELRMEHDEFTIRSLLNLLNESVGSFTYAKLKIIILVFRELNLLHADEIDSDREIYKFKYVFVKNKTDLDKSGLYKKIKSNFFKNNQ